MAGNPSVRGVDMYVQIIEGRAKDRARMRELMDRWSEELRPGADGFLGSTAGVTDDGRAIAFARFESEAAAVANSDRPEQGAWWEEMSACYDGDVTFTGSDEVEPFLAGGSNDAGFVQVMKSSAIDRSAMARMDAAFESVAATMRPDVIGSLRICTGPTSAYDVTYFTSEAEAREGEAKDFPPEFADLMDDVQAIMASTDFIDLRGPWLY
jgi:hypothetical protein